MPGISRSIRRAIRIENTFSMGRPTVFCVSRSLFADVSSKAKATCIDSDPLAKISLSENLCFVTIL